MPDIHVLAPHVADLIAAGEVVERPASAVKELLENAVDAGAGKVTAEISHGGLTFLRVTDDGKGIPPEQLKTAFLRHATSKLRTEYDLEAIGTLGFRGEALAAIAAVSRIDVMTRTPGAALGAALHLEGGISGEVEEAGCPEGTTMVVRDLFYNTPARLKFMKKDAAEGAAVFAAVQRLALSRPEVSVRFLRDGKQELLTPGDGRLQSAVYAVLGRELALGFLPVEGSGEDLAVRGFVSRPSCCRGSRACQYFFVNGRFIRSPALTAAVEEAYANQKMVGRFPGCVLHLETKLNAVDVNVHPAKTEVKFTSERQVFSAVYHAVLAALGGDTLRPAAAVRPAPPRPSPLPGEAPHVSAEQFRAGTLHDVTALRRSPPAFLPPPARRVPAAETRQAPPPERERVPDPPPSRRTEPAPPPKTERPPEKPLPPAPEAPGEELPWRVAGEVLNTYIIVEQGEKVLLIDKHAAHERMNFDRLKAEEHPPMGQLLLTPVTFTPSPEEGAALLEHLPLLRQFGFEAEELGRGTLVVRQAPDYLSPEDIAPTLTALAGRLLSGASADPAAARDELLHTMACKAAIKGGWKTSPQELERVARAVMSGEVRYCPHGRPVAVELTKKELEKQFRRA